jgi:hypothetical protein
MPGLAWVGNGSTDGYAGLVISSRDQKMALKSRDDLGISEDLLDAVRSLPAEREVEHCGAGFKVSTFDFYAECPHCGSRLKLRSLSGVPEVEDVFDAVFERLNDTAARRVAERRRQAIQDDAG